MARSDMKVRDEIPEHFASIEEAAQFWDSHDLSDYWDMTEAAEFDVDLTSRRYLVALDPALVNQLTEAARRRGVTTETLINLWLAEKLRQPVG